MWLGVHAADRVSSLVLANTAARIGSVQSWTDRIALVQQQGMRGVAELAMQMWFSPDFHQRRPDVVARFKTMVETCPTTGYLGCCAALRDEDLREAIADNQLPGPCGRRSHRCANAARGARVHPRAHQRIEAAHARRRASEQRRAGRRVHVSRDGFSRKSLNNGPRVTRSTSRSMCESSQLEVVNRGPMNNADRGQRWTYSPVTLTVIVSHSPVIVACLSSPACTTSLCIPGESCMSIVFLPVAEMDPWIGLRNDRACRQAIGVHAEVVMRGVRAHLCFRDFTRRHWRDRHHRRCRTRGAPGFSPWHRWPAP